ncbi:MAG: sigma-70 family RNA polymerase sigma factor [Dehalococcoidia bacterium]|nr:sigma-70 family RNA polymerase sigma factor [Dehalococcoidia bacterium]
MTSPKLSSSPNRPDAAVDRRVGEFARVYEKFFPRVFAYVYGRVHSAHLAEDLVADVFERAFLKMDSLRNGDALSTWLFTIARNIIISHARKFSRETVVDPEIIREIAPARDSVEHEILMREEVRTLARLVRRLPQREQDIVALKFDAELSNTQIAQIMELNEPNVRVILFRTLRKLRQMMVAEANG